MPIKTKHDGLCRKHLETEYTQFVEFIDVSVSGSSKWIGEIHIYAFKLRYITKECD